MFFEHPDTSFFPPKQNFLHIPKPTYKIPIPQNPTFISIPTTSPTPSQLTPFPLITHTQTNLKYPFPHFPLTPHLPIIHPQFLITLPKTLTAHTPIHLLTHPIQS
ncbi:iron-containing alcohol dehydrogenase, partial [Staphylococcus aureus]|uniref:iron-containing alcohol dehydrogenase n=1 Tax=Staphylococcus aureus TaxID=1280 RepID=UPI0011A66079